MLYATLKRVTMLGRALAQTHQQQCALGCHMLRVSQLCMSGTEHVSTAACDCSQTSVLLFHTWVQSCPSSTNMPATTAPRQDPHPTPGKRYPHTPCWLLTF
jgi:hypothetical protein